MTKSPSDRGDLGQREKFVRTARELGCDEDPEAFKRVVRKLAKAQPSPRRERAKKARPP